MNRNFFWDLGFDMNAITPLPFGQSFVQNGFVLIRPADPEGRLVNVPATPVNLSVGDSIGFNLFDVTASAGTRSIASGSITFRSAVTDQDTASPFEDSTLTIPPGSTIGEGPRVIFGGIQADQVPAENPPTFPRFSGPATQTVVNEGRFLMHVTLDITGDGGETVKSFLHDPEMVVGSIG